MARAKAGIPPNLIGATYGRLAVISHHHSDHATGRGYHHFWRCRCDDCGRFVTVSQRHLKSGHTQSCGCLRVATIVRRFTTHGQSKTVEYQAWLAMKNRCSNPNFNGFKDYGGRGISVCDRWLHSFDHFLADMGLRPSARHSLDRFPNNDGDYEPSNCRWATTPQQNRQKRANRHITFDGRTQCLMDWANEIGVSQQTISDRLSKGWPMEVALARHVALIPVKVDAKVRGKKLLYQGREVTLTELSRELGIHKSTLFNRMKRLSPLRSVT